MGRRPRAGRRGLRRSKRPRPHLLYARFALEELLHGGLAVAGAAGVVAITSPAAAAAAAAAGRRARVGRAPRALRQHRRVGVLDRPVQQALLRGGGGWGEGPGADDARRARCAAAAGAPRRARRTISLPAAPASPASPAALRSTASRTSPSSNAALRGAGGSGGGGGVSAPAPAPSRPVGVASALASSAAAASSSAAAGRRARQRILWLQLCRTGVAGSRRTAGVAAGGADPRYWGETPFKVRRAGSKHCLQLTRSRLRCPRTQGARQRRRVCRARRKVRALSRLRNTSSEAPSTNPQGADNQSAKSVIKKKGGSGCMRALAGRHLAGVRRVQAGVQVAMQPQPRGGHAAPRPPATAAHCPQPGGRLPNCVGMPHAADSGKPGQKLLDAATAASASGASRQRVAVSPAL